MAMAQIKKTGAKKPHKRTFESMTQKSIPHSRLGKHHTIVFTIMDDVASLDKGNALKVPLKALGDTKENVRAALGRESKKRGTPIATAADTQFLYVWRD